MASKATATVVLTSANMGEKADQADFYAWHAYVARKIDEMSGADVTVEMAPYGQGGDEDKVEADDDCEDAVKEALRTLWDDFCADKSAWPARDAELSARVMDKSVEFGGEEEREIDFYVRSTRKGTLILSPDSPERDAWTAYVETPIAVSLDNKFVTLKRVECVGQPRDTVEEAARDMWRAVAARVAHPWARLVRGKMPDDLKAQSTAARELAEAAERDPKLASDLSDA
jgi:hypothetical protein